MTYQEIIDKVGGFIYYPVGTSMLPLIKEGVHSVKLVRLTREVKKYDVVLYRRDNGQFVLHRVVKVKKDSFNAMGDNQWVIEKGIKKDSIIAIMESMYLGDKEIVLNTFKYKMYSRFRLWFRFFRRLKSKLIRTFKKRGDL